MSIWNKIKNLLGYETVRARDSKGRYIKDDPTTPENEAFVTRKKKTETPAAPKRKRGRPRKTK
tara:strand:+ start:813 stop:1001 length:189 start_codon:yes stop_codon:yes gene_type:complete